jgi:hypothetical protein
LPDRRLPATLPPLMRRARPSLLSCPDPRGSDGLPAGGRFPARRGLVLVPVLLAALALTGCKLVDQRTFDPSAGRPPPPPVLPQRPAPLPVPPLATVVAGSPADDWKPALVEIARAALARKPNVLFRVISRVPAAGDPDAQARALQGVATGTGQAVADALVSAGVPAGQIELTGRSDPGVRQPDVQVFVR